MAIVRKCITLASCAIRLGSQEGAQQPAEGMSWEARMLVTVFIERTEDEVRLISARLATPTRAEAL